MTPDRAEWPAGRPRVLVTDCWLANAGDAAIALGLERMIREIAPAAAVLHAAYQHESLGPHIPGLTFVPPLEDLLGTPWVPARTGWEDAGRRLVGEADLIVSQGGGFLVEAYEPFGRIAALADATTIGPPTVLLGQTIGRFTTSIGRRHLGAVMRDAALVVVRDAPSGDHAAELGATEVELLGTDLALALFAERPVPADRKGTSVVLTAHHPEPSRRAGQADAADAVLQEVLARTRSEPVKLWSTVQGAPVEAGEDDREVAVSAIGRANAADSATLVDGYVPPLEAIDRVRSARRLVTMRMHPALFAAGTGTPFALLLSSQKRSVLEDTSLVECVAEPEDRAGVSRALDRMWSMREADALALWDALAPLRVRLDRTRDLLAEFLVPVASRKG